jgi:hypothetical protein
MVGAVDPAGLTLSLGAGDLLHEEDDDLDDDLWEAIRLVVWAMEGTMAPKITRRTILAGVSAVVLLAVAFGAGAWAGADLTGRFYGSMVLPRATANAKLLHLYLAKLEAGDAKGLRELLNMELEGELLTMCLALDASDASARDTVDRARFVLRDIARYRAEKPATYPTAFQAQGGEGPGRKVKECLGVALASPEK